MLSDYPHFGNGIIHEYIMISLCAEILADWSCPVPMSQHKENVFYYRITCVTGQNMFIPLEMGQD